MFLMIVCLCENNFLDEILWLLLTTVQQPFWSLKLAPKQLVEAQ